MNATATDNQEEKLQDVEAPNPNEGRGFRKELSWVYIQRASGIVLFIVVLFYLPPTSSLWNWVFDQLYDHGIFYNPEKEGLIAVSSPQLFTRERLINQRLEESAWIDRRIAAVDKMIEDERFSKPSDIRRVNEEIRIASKAMEKGTNDEHGESWKGTMGDLQKDPLSEFKSANSYRQHLVQEKFQSILDDAHDTYSNTLQRLNFNLAISPAQNHSTSVAAVSITLEQPTDPEWILYKYGELLIDVRDELQQTARRMITDRRSIFLPENNYLLNTRTNDLLISEIDRLISEYNRTEWRRNLEDLKKVMLDQHLGTSLQRFQAHLHGIGEDPAIGVALTAIFFPSREPLLKPLGSGLPPDEDASFPPLTSSDLGKQSPPAPDVQSLGRSLQGACSQGSTSIWLLLPPGATERKEYKMLEETYKVFAKEAAFRLSDDKSNDTETTAVGSSHDERWKLELRELLSQKTFDAPCAPGPERLSQLAMLELLGDLSLNAAYKQGWEQHCSYANKKKMSDFKSKDFAETTLNNMTNPGLWAWAKSFESPADFWQRCGNHRQALLEIGIAHLVHAELKNTPIDTAGRVRRLDDYFSLRKDDCDLNSCQLIVWTKSEAFRSNGLRALNSNSAGKWRKWVDEETSTCLDLEARHLRPFDDYLQPRKAQQDKVEAKFEVEKCALMIGRQEALRLFAELSCFASARSYTVYPREGVGESVLEQGSRGWSLSSLLGREGASASLASERARITQSVPILGIGDNGGQRRGSVGDCGRSFLAVLNNLNVKDDLTVSLKTVLEGQSDFIDDKVWQHRVSCLLKEAGDVSGDENGYQKLEDADKGKCSRFPKDLGEVPEPSVTEFDLNQLTAVIRQLRQRQTTISWIVLPKDEGIWGTRHSAQSVPLSAIVSLPSWWPGVRIVTETCWLRPKRMHAESGRRLCPNTKEDVQGSHRHTAQILPLPYNLEDVLPKLGFFLIRYPYVDRFESSDITLESGREAQLRLTGKRLWKNPKVRIGEQWHTKVEVLPDMRGVVATFKCLGPLSHGSKKRMIVDGVNPIEIFTSPKKYKTPYSANKGDLIFADTHDLIERYTESRPVQVWTSEGNTSQITVTVRAFRPNFRLDGKIEAPCWADSQIEKAK